jgi:cobalt-zinc-cadmium resistance protein CzcA
MLERILDFSLRRRGLVVVATILLAAYGGYCLVGLPIDAVPDITNRQVQINVTAASLSPLEVEKQITFPLETALAGIPGLDHTRSFSRNGFAQITAVFHDDVDLFFARQQVAERVSAVRGELPDDAEPSLGPISTGLGEIYMWTVEFEHPGGHGATVADGHPGWQSDGAYLTPEGERLTTHVERAAFLRTVQDWIIRPQIAALEGVAGVDAIGGYVKQYHVEPDPRLLAAYGLGFHDLVEALERNNSSLGAGYIEHNGEAFTVRADGRVRSKEEIAEIPVAGRGGVPIRVRDVATVHVGGELRTGSATENGEEVVVGTAMMLFGANSRTVAHEVDRHMATVARTLPVDVRAKPVLDRTRLVDATVDTVRTNLAEGALLVVVVLFALLGNLRAAIITALAIPLSMLLAAIGMARAGTSVNLMSLGAVDFGLIVDGAVIIVENCLKRLAERQRELGRPLDARERVEVVFAASKQVRNATAFGEAIIIMVYIPILALTGVEGKMFAPMATTVIFALVAAFVLSLTFVPAMVALFVRGPIRNEESAIVRHVQHAYRPALLAALRWRGAVIVAAVVFFVSSLLLGTRLGQEFVPTLSELDLLVQAYRIPSTGLTQSTEMQKVIERRVAEFPEVAYAFSKTGTAEAAADPMPPYVSDTFIMLKPRAEWPDSTETKDDVRERIEEALAAIPGNAYEFTQPIQMRFNELLAGTRGDVAVKIFGDEFAVLLPVAHEVAQALRDIEGAADTRIEEVQGAPVLGIDVDREAIARYGLTVADVQEILAAATGGREAGHVFQGDRRFDIVVRLPDEFREDQAALANLPVPLSHEERRASTVALRGDDIQRADLHYLPLDALATLGVTVGPNQISRENGKRRIVVQTNVRGRDVGSFVEEARKRIDAEIALPPGSWISWGGQYENLVRARGRLAVVVPICLAGILVLLYSTFGAFAPAALVFTGVPLALTGGILSLWLRDMPLSMSAGVGFIALSGVAVLNGLVMLTFINELRARGVPTDEAVVEGAVARLRPVLMTALVASLGFVPMALATGTGAEVQRPLATVVIGGLLSSTLLTLFVLPALYRVLAPPQLPHARDGA